MPSVHRARHVHRDHHVQLALGVRVAHERRIHPRRHVPVDAPDVVARAVGLVLVEVEARAAQRALIRADPLVADLLRRCTPRCSGARASRAPGIMGWPPPAAAPSGSRRRSTFSACARTVRAMRWRAVSQKISLTSSGSTYVRPCRNAVTRASASRCWYERGDMPSSSSSFRSPRPTSSGVARRAAEPDDVFEDLVVDVDTACG